MGSDGLKTVASVIGERPVARRVSCDLLRMSWPSSLRSTRAVYDLRARCSWRRAWLVTSAGQIPTRKHYALAGTGGVVGALKSPVPVVRSSQAGRAARTDLARNHVPRRLFSAESSSSSCRNSGRLAASMAAEDRRQSGRDAIIGRESCRKFGGNPPPVAGNCGRAHPPKGRQNMRTLVARFLAIRCVNRESRSRQSAVGGSRDSV